MDSTPRLLLLTPEQGHSTALDGAWWPRSADLAEELPDLAAGLSDAGITVIRLSYGPALWDPAPRKALAGGRLVRLGAYPTMDPHLVSVRGSGGQRIELLVVPPDTEPGIAERAMTEAAALDNHATPTAVLRAAGA